jgi:hypothetical protein
VDVGVLIRTKSGLFVTAAEIIPVSSISGGKSVSPFCAARFKTSAISYFIILSESRNNCYNSYFLAGSISGEDIILSSIFRDICVASAVISSVFVTISF